jgi:hypothetical protein
MRWMEHKGHLYIPTGTTTHLFHFGVPMLLKIFPIVPHVRCLHQSMLATSDVHSIAFHFPNGRPELGFGNRRPVQLLCHFRLGYTTLNDDLGRMRNIGPSRLCPCGLANESYIHYFFECPKYNESRRKLYNYTVAMSRAVLLSIILNGIEGDSTKSSCILKFTHVFISESNRF